MNGPVHKKSYVDEDRKKGANERKGVHAHLCTVAHLFIIATAAEEE